LIRSVLGGEEVAYAAEDYSHFWHGHDAFWHCEHECDVKCNIRGGHKFGCYDEKHLQAFKRQYGHRSGFKILHDDVFGNIC